jgi:hypothetical protein
MQCANEFYKTAITRHEWEKASPQEQQVLALQVKINKLSKEKDHQKNRRQKKNHKNNRNGDSQTSSKGKADRPDKPDWLKDNIKPPAASIRETKTWNNMKWYYCCTETGGKCPGNWRIHAPSDCKGIAKQEGSKQNKKRNASSMKITAANEAIAMKPPASDEDDSSGPYYYSDSD